ncbi:MAG: nucleotide sugar dehydrogenase [Candidatus Bathyarchaeaceae archaeon]
MKKALIKMMRTREAHIAVIGLGHVGLTTTAIFADAGFQVTGADLKQEVVKAVSSGKSHIKEPRLDELVGKVVRQGRLKATTNTRQAAREADIVILCVQTPINENKEPSLTYLGKACEAVAEGLLKGKLVIVQSTVPPGTTKNFVAKILEEGSGLKCGEDFWLAYCPERIAPGKAVQEFIENVRIVGGYNSESVEIAVELFKTVTKGEILTTDCTSAEIAKVAENAFRDANIAFANELALICEQIGSDVMEVIRLANTHPRVNIHKPGCGVGGPCLPKDPYLLLHPVRDEGFKSRAIKPSRELNDYMSKHAVELVVKALRKLGKDVGESKVAVLGVAYKGEVDETRNSPAETIVRELMDLGAEVVVYDPYCRESFGAGRAKDVMEAVGEADCIVIATDHKMFRELELGRIKALMNENPALVDGRRIVHPLEAKKHGFVYYGVGFSGDDLLV